MTVLRNARPKFSIRGEGASWYLAENGKRRHCSGVAGITTLPGKISLLFRQYFVSVFLSSSLTKLRVKSIYKRLVGINITSQAHREEINFYILFLYYLLTGHNSHPYAPPSVPFDSFWSNPELLDSILMGSSLPSSLKAGLRDSFQPWAAIMLDGIDSERTSSVAPLRKTQSRTALMQLRAMSP